MFKIRSKPPKSAAVAFNYEPFFGITRHVYNNVLSGKMTLMEYHMSCVRAQKWKPFGWGALGGVVGIFIVDPKDIKHILKDSFNTHIKGLTMTTNFQVLLGNGIFNTNGSEWKHQRIAMSGMFSKRKLRDRMSTVFGTHAQVLALCFGRAADSKEVVNAQKLFYCYTFDSINRIAFNKDVDSLRGDEEDCAFQAAFDAAQKGVSERFLVPWWRVNRFFNRGMEKQVAEAMVVIDAYMTRVVDSYFDDNDELREDMMVGDDTMIALYLQHGKEEGTQYTKKYLRDMILNAVIAGRDTTGSTLTSAIAFLCDHPEWQKKLRAEALEVFGGNVQEVLTFDDLEGKSPIAEAVFMESARLNPPVPGNEKEATEDTVLPSGIKLHKGEYCTFASYVTNRHPDYWGPDAEEFKPERWLGDKAKEYDDYMYSTFQAGPRLCLGKNMAILEGKIALLTVMAQYEFTMEKGFAPVQGLGLTWVFKNGLRVNVRRV